MRALTPATLLLLPTLVGCLDQPTGPSFDDAQRTLDSARAIWDAAEIEDYDYDYQRLCSCPDEELQPVAIEVRADTVESVHSLETGEPITVVSDDVYLTADEIFDVLQGAIDQRAAGIAATFHVDLGYPLTARIDYDSRVLGDQVEYFIEGLEPVEVTP